VLLRPSNFSALHRAWLAATLIVAVACLAGYCAQWRGNAARLGEDRWPGGGSVAGLVCGLLAGAICLFETAFVLRKTSLFRTRRRILGIPLGSARAWMAAHVWLGLLTVPLVALHSGLRFGGTLTWLLTWTFILVITSGALGLVLQNVLPRLMTDAVPDETIYSQINEVGRQLAADAMRLARLYGGQSAECEDEPAAAPSEPIAAGAPRRIGTMVALARQPRPELPANADVPELREAVARDVVPFLRTGHSPSGKLSSPQRIGWFFDDLARRVPPESRRAVEEIAALCLRRRQFNVQARIHFWLHSWLVIHLPLSVALVWLLAAHVVGAIAFQ
jgi:hypothetical protein